MAVHPGPCPPGFTYDVATARALVRAVERLADAAEDLAGHAAAGREAVESAAFAGRTADQVRERHGQLDDDLGLLADAARDQADVLRREIQVGADHAAAAAATQRRWRRDLAAWQDAS